ncbi:flavodoxin [bacterium]|nr:flavodoxin [bacterium]
MFRTSFTVAAALALLAAGTGAQSLTAGKTATGTQIIEGKPMKILVAYYSRTGTTKQVCTELAAQLGADLEQITDTKKRSGIFGYLGGGRDAMKKVPTTIGTLACDPSQYDLVVLASPVWAGHVAPALRTYLTQAKGKIKKTAFLCTMGGSGDAGTFADMRELTGLEPAARLTLLQREVKKGAHAAKLKEFADKLK